jgi:hypothetical protein
LKDVTDDFINFLQQNITDFEVEDISESELMFFGISAYGIVFSIIFNFLIKKLIKCLII